MTTDWEASKTSILVYALIYGSKRYNKCVFCSTFLCAEPTPHFSFLRYYDKSRNIVRERKRKIIRKGKKIPVDKEGSKKYPRNGKEK